MSGQHEAFGRDQKTGKCPCMSGTLLEEGVFTAADMHILPSLSGLSHLGASNYPPFVISAIKSIGLTPPVESHVHHVMF